MTKTGTERLPVCHPGLKSPNGAYYTLGHATTERGAMTVLRRRSATSSANLKGVRLVSVGSKTGFRVWMGDYT